jgi:hypothetical protein
VLKQTSILSIPPLQPAPFLPRLQEQLDVVALANEEKPLLLEIEQLSSRTGRIPSIFRGLKHELLFKQQNLKPTEEMATFKQVQELRADFTTIRLCSKDGLIIPSLSSFSKHSVSWMNKSRHKRRRSSLSP